MTFKFNRWRDALLGLCLALLFAGSAAIAQNQQETNDSPGSMTMKQAWSELFQLSQKDKKGLTFYVKGQTIPGIVTRIIGDEAVEVKNQTSARIVIRLESVDAIALN